MNNILNRKISLNSSIKIEPKKIIFVLIGIIIVSPLGAFIFKNNFKKLILYYTTTLRIVGLLILLFLIVYFIMKIKSDRLYFKNIKSKISFELSALTFMMLWMLVSCLLSDNPSIAFLGDWRGEGYLSYIAYFAIFLGTYTVSTERTMKKLVLLFSYVSYIAAIIGLLSYNGLFYIVSNTTSLSAMFINSNHYGYYLVVALIISSYHLISSNNTKRKIHIVGLLLISLSLFLTNCKGAMLGGMIALVIYVTSLIIRKENKLIVSLLPLIISTISLIFVQLIYGDLWIGAMRTISDINAIIVSSEGKFDAGTKRWLLWTGAFKLFPKLPIFGFGLDNYHSQLLSLSIIHTNRVHNEYLHYILTIGFIGALAYFSCLFNILLQFIKKRSKMSLLELSIFCAMLAYLGSAFFGNTTPYVTPLLFVCMGSLSKSQKV
ncbi:MAG: O-antigen ligase family protein [Clostridiales bacterium]|nr:O-antigen ligase family protein [Clostridiales bacterium]